jgi:hypothetical protein
MDVDEEDLVLVLDLERRELEEELLEAASLLRLADEPREVLAVAVLEVAVARVRAARPERLRVLHGQDERAEAAARLPDHGPRVARGDRPVTAVDLGHDLLDEVGHVLPRPGGVDVLGAPEARRAVGEDGDDGRDHLRGDEPVEPVGERLVEGGDVEQHAPRPREAGEDVDRREPPVGLLGVGGGEVDRHLARRRVAERVPREARALERQDRDRSARRHGRGPLLRPSHRKRSYPVAVAVEARFV